MLGIYTVRLSNHCNRNIDTLSRECHGILENVSWSETYPLVQIHERMLQAKDRNLRGVYLQRSYPSEYKRYRRHAFIIISIEDSTSMPDPAPQPQEQPPQVPRPPQDAVVWNIVASATPALDTPDQLEVHVILVFPFFSFSLSRFVHLQAGLSRAHYPRGPVFGSSFPLLVLVLCGFFILFLYV